MPSTFIMKDGVHYTVIFHSIRIPSTLADQPSNASAILQLSHHVGSISFTAEIPIKLRISSFREEGKKETIVGIKSQHPWLNVLINEKCPIKVASSDLFYC